jgi:allantoin racemase
VACLLGHTFSIVTTSPRWKPMLEDAVRAYGLQDRCASVRTSGLAVLDLEARPHEQVVETLLEEGRRAVAEDGAEVICLGCAGMAGLDKRLEEELGVPVLDSVVCAVKLAELLGDYGLSTSKVNTFRPVDPREVLNLPPLFAAAYRRPTPPAGAGRGGDGDAPKGRDQSDAI